MKKTIIALIAIGCLVQPAAANDELKAQAKDKLELARDKYKKGEEAEAIDICREAAKLGSTEAQAQISAWLLERSLPKKTDSAVSKTLKEAEKSEQTVVNILEQEIQALMKQCQQCQANGEMTKEQMELMMQLMAMAGMKPGDKPGSKPGQQPGNTPGMNNSGGNTNKDNEEIPGSVDGPDHAERKSQKLAGRNTQLPKEFQSEFKEFFKGVDQLRKNRK